MNWELIDPELDSETNRATKFIHLALCHGMVVFASGNGTRGIDTKFRLLFAFSCCCIISRRRVDEHLCFIYKRIQFEIVVVKVVVVFDSNASRPRY